MNDEDVRRKKKQHGRIKKEGSRPESEKTKLQTQKRLLAIIERKRKRKRKYIK